ncbi:MAG: biopolymer transporter ExbD [Ignavibacteria bacterium]|nr:biopolymer transporter ExbD [Ignavibacteria bacterium]
MKIPKAKKRSGVKIDMTPMVDVIMLLLTFFMLTATFKAAESEAVSVNLPKSVNTDSVKIPAEDVMTILIDTDGDVFVDVDNYNVREKVFGNKFGMGLWHVDSTSQTSKQISPAPEVEGAYRLETGGSVRIVKLLNRESFEKTLIDLRLTLKNMTEGKSDFRIVVKGDRNAEFGVIEDLMAALKETRNTRFSLVTIIESEKEAQEE